MVQFNSCYASAVSLLALTGTDIEAPGSCILLRGFAFCGSGGARDERPGRVGVAIMAYVVWSLCDTSNGRRSLRWFVTRFALSTLVPGRLRKGPGGPVVTFFRVGGT